MSLYSDGDGLADAEEGLEDVDLDGLPNFLDFDRCSCLSSQLQISMSN